MRRWLKICTVDWFKFSVDYLFFERCITEKGFRRGEKTFFTLDDYKLKNG